MAESPSWVCRAHSRVLKGAENLWGGERAAGKDSGTLDITARERVTDSSLLCYPRVPASTQAREPLTHSGAVVLKMGLVLSLQG